MDTAKLISLTQCSLLYQVEDTLLENLAAMGLIEITVLNQETFVHHEQLKELERIIRLHKDLDINLEGIDVISHLLLRLQDLQQEVNMLRNKLRIYEEH